jgi:folate-dependent phosphoribosylglycinamide formyltransferase PurN
MTSITTTVFFGSNYKVAQSINRSLPLSGIYVEERGFNCNIYNYAQQQGINFHIVTTLDDLNILCQSQPQLAVMYGFGLIMGPIQIQAFEHGIWNIHPGKLPEYRGRHPISWALINNEQSIGLCIHRINHQIDQGTLLSSTEIPRDMNDNQIDIDKKFETVIEAGLFNEALSNYTNGVSHELTAGKYHESLISKFKEIRPAEHNSTFVFNLFKSQSTFGGVSVAGTLFTQCHFYNEAMDSHYADGKVFSCLDGKKVILSSVGI